MDGMGGWAEVLGYAGRGCGVRDGGLQSISSVQCMASGQGGLAVWLHRISIMSCQLDAWLDGGDWGQS
jgi:hypothetical protein